MNLSLLVPLLLIGFEESQATNMTQEEPSEASTNQTFSFSTFNNSTMSTYNVTEMFQDVHGNKDDMESSLFQVCLTNFRSNMMTISPEDWCVLERITIPYSNLTSCIEVVFALISWPYPNSFSQDLFIEIHSVYFHNCTREEVLFEDAPHWLVIVLTLIPVSLIPILIYMVVWKSKVQE